MILQLTTISNNYHFHLLSDCMYTAMQAIKVPSQDISYNSKHSVHQDFLTKA